MTAATAAEHLTLPARRSDHQSLLDAAFSFDPDLLEDMLELNEDLATFVHRAGTDQAFAARARLRQSMGQGRQRGSRSHRVSLTQSPRVREPPPKVPACLRPLTLPLHLATWLPCAHCVCVAGEAQYSGLARTRSHRTAAAAAAVDAGRALPTVPSAAGSPPPQEWAEEAAASEAATLRDTVDLFTDRSGALAWGGQRAQRPRC